MAVHDNLKSFYESTAKKLVFQFFLAVLTIYSWNKILLIFYLTRDDMKYDANHRAAFFVVVAQISTHTNENILSLHNILKILNKINLITKHNNKFK